MPVRDDRPDAAAPHFSPHRHDQRPCWHCRHFGALTPFGTAWCIRPATPGSVSRPAGGCAFWSREPGTDDEPGTVPPPAGAAQCARLTPPPPWARAGS